MARQKDHTYPIVLDASTAGPVLNTKANQDEGKNDRKGKRDIIFASPRYQAMTYPAVKSPSEMKYVLVYNTENPEMKDGTSTLGATSRNVVVTGAGAYPGGGEQRGGGVDPSGEGGWREGCVGNRRPRLL